MLALLNHVGWETYATAPGAKGHHHAYIYGLLEHSVEVAELALGIAHRSRYREHVDLDAVIVGALLHDLGKVNVYRWRCERTGKPARIDISRWGRLADHVRTGPMLVQGGRRQAADGTQGRRVPWIDVRHLVHVMASHHGTLEWGSPTPPSTVEAQIIHQADNASAKVRSLADVLETHKCRTRAGG